MNNESLVQIIQIVCKCFVICFSFFTFKIIHQVISLAGKKGGKVAKESGQLRAAALKQPKSVRQKIGKNLINYAHKNPRNATKETITNRQYKKVFHIYEKLTERTIGNHLGDVIFNPEEDKTLNVVCSMILEKYGIKVYHSHLNKVANGNRRVDKTVI
jgi:hypothetical protein